MVLKSGVSPVIEKDGRVKSKREGNVTMADIPVAEEGAMLPATRLRTITMQKSSHE